MSSSRESAATPGDPAVPDDSVLDSLRGAVDPLESRHESDPEHPTDLKTQIIRFFLTGVLSAIVDFGITAILQFGFGVQYPLAKSIGFIAGTTTAYLINRRWTFSAEPSRKRFVAVMVLYGVMFAVQVGLATLVFEMLTRADVAEGFASFAGFVVGQGVATVTNFIVQRTVIFRVR